jgi:predicted N-acetyltransferase YhbS
MEPAWHLRRYRNGDEHSVFELERDVYPHQGYDRSAWLKCWHWLHRENPAGPSAIVVAEHNGLIVGHSAIIPVLLKLGSEVITAFQPVQLMVHPEYRRQGMFLALDRALFAEAKDRNMLVGFGFPATPTYRGAVASLSWFPVATTRRMLRVSSWKDALRLRTNSRILLEFGAACGMVLSATLGKSRAGQAHKAIEVR